MLYPYQYIGASFLAARKRALLADGMGLGKSAQAVAACDAIRAQRIVVVCPASVRVVWQREFEKWQKTPRTVQIMQTRKDRANGSDVTVISYDLAAQRTTPFVHADVLILDESHYLKSHKAKRTKAVLGRWVHTATRVWALSGTPAPNDPSELWPLCKALFPEAIEGKNGRPMPLWDFVTRYCRTRDVGFGRQIIGGKRLDELRERLNPHMLRRKVEDVLDDLPPIRFHDVALEPSELRKELAAAEIGPEGAQMAALLAALDKDSPDAKGIAMHVASLRRLIGLAKVKPVVDLVRDELEAGLRKVVLFAWHRDVIRGLAQGLSGCGPLVVMGETPPRERQRAIDRFQADDGIHSVFIGQIQAAGTGITLTAASEVVMVEQSWTPADNAQAIKRCHRIGQFWPVRARFVGLAGSIDERVAQVLRRKTADLAQIFDPEAEKTLASLLA